jgi:hypothetical protein
MVKILLTYLPLALIITSVVGFLYMNYSKSSGRRNRSKDKEFRMKDEDQQVDYSRLIRLYEMFSKFPLTSKGTNQLHDLMSGIGVYSVVEQRVETARLLLTSYVMLMGAFTLVAFITNNPILMIGAVIVAIVFRRDFINKKLRKERVAFWEDLYRSLTSLKNEYERCGAVPKAFNKAVVEDKARLIMGTIEALFKSRQPQADLAYFCQNNSYNVLQRLAHLCYTSHYYGVSISPTTGIDTFVANLDVIMNNLQVDIDMAQKEKKKFYSVEKLPLVALAIVLVMPTFMESRYPGVHYYYSSAIGYICMIASMFVIILGYMVSTTLNDQDRPVDDTFAFEVRLFMKPNFKKFWENRLPKYNKPVENLLRESLSYLTPAQYKFRQTYCALLLGLFVFLSSLVYTVVEESSTVTNLGSLPAETLAKIHKKYDSPDEFAKKLVLNSSIKTKQDMAKALSEEHLNLDAVTTQLISNILMKNRENYLDAKYSPLYLFAILGAMILGFNVPHILLKRRTKLVAVEVKNEILILYSLVVQMMYTPLKLRDYLKQFVYVSRLYPKTHLDCYVNQFNNPTFLKEVASNMFNPQYYDFMEKLYTLRADKVAPEIFRETERRREYLFGKVLEVREEKLKTNYQILSILLWVALLVPLTLEVIIPLAQFSYTSISQYSNLIQD